MDRVLIILNELENNINNLDKLDLSSNFNNLFSLLEELKLNLEEKRKIYDRIKNIYKIIKEENNPILLDAKLNIESFLIAYFYEFRDYQGDKYKLIEYILFELKDFDIVSDIINKYPSMINIKDSNNEFILINIINKYLEELDNYTKNYQIKKIHYLGYYEQVISLFINHDTLELDEAKKNDILNKINTFKINVNNKFFNDNTKRKYFFWINNLIDILNKKEIETLESLLYKYDINTSFDLSILKEISYLKEKEIDNIESGCIIAIDGEGAKEIDDALSAAKLENGNYKLDVYIADPSYYIDKSSIIFDEACNRCSSIYFGKLNIPLFPSILGKDKMSLLENKKRACLKFEVEINNRGEIEKFDIKKTFIKLNKNITYKEVDDILLHGSDNKEIEITINLLREIAYKFKNRLQMSDTYLILNRTKPNITETNIIDKTNSNMIVEMSMLIVNYSLAKYMYDKNLPFIYRNHVVDNNTKKEIKKLMKRMNDSSYGDVKKIYNYLSSIYPKSYYDTKCLGHNGLGISKYTHISSPLRREADLINIYYCLNYFVFDETCDLDAYRIEELIKERANYINEKNIMMNNFSKVYYKKR